MSASPDWLQHGYPYTPYCGLPPTPAELLQRWNLDPLLVSGLVVFLVVYAVGAEPGGPGAIPRWRRLCFYGGWVLGALALTSPLCALSVSLFSARIGQQMLLAAVVAPLVTLGRPAAAFARGHRRRLGRARGREKPNLRQPILASVAFATAIWAWHAPSAYAATFESTAAYWTMHLTTFAAAVWLWSALLEPAPARPGGVALASVLTAIQINLLAAMIACSGQLNYLPHVVTAGVWGFTPLQDQRLGGMVMWVPAAVIFGGVALFNLARAVRRGGGGEAGARPVIRPA